jgi:Nuclease-related domain/AAA domain
VGLVVPEDFPLATLANGEERAVVEALRDQLSDDWLVLPDVGIAGERDSQMDVVIAHPQRGVAVIEVKGHRVEIRHGLFYAHGAPMDPQPDSQARANAYRLRGHLRRSGGTLEHLRVEYAIAFPNTTSVRGELPPDLLRAQVLTVAALEEMAGAVDELMSARWGNQPIGTDGIRALVQSLRPDADMEWDHDAITRRARRRMDELCTQRVKALEGLDANRRVFVRGGAGSGKSRLAVAWARRASARGERVLLTCFNDPLATVLREELPPHERLRVGSFFEVGFGLDGMPAVERPPDADATWWDTVAVGHLHRHWPEVTECFDVVIVDEAQDFSPAWLAQLAQLLDRRGSRRLMLLADEAQGVFARGFVSPSTDDGWTVYALEDNCRNTFGIASLLFRRLEGSRPLAGPESLDVRWRRADDVEATIDQVGAEIDWIEATGYAIARVLVATTHRSVRDRLREAMGFGMWEQRGDYTYICENVQRMKGLEFDFVVLVADVEVPDLLLYVGLSRAISGFCLVAPESVAERLGLSPIDDASTVTGS